MIFDTLAEKQTSILKKGILTLTFLKALLVFFFTSNMMRKDTQGSEQVCFWEKTHREHIECPSMLAS